MRFGIVLATLVACGCAGSSPETATDPRQEPSTQGAESPATHDPPDLTRREIVAMAKDSDDAAEGAATGVETPPDLPAIPAAPAEPGEDRHFLVDPDEPTRDPVEVPSAESTGSGAPIDPPTPSSGRPTLPSTIRLNPLRAKTSLRASGEPLIIESRPRSPYQAGSAAARAPMPVRTPAGGFPPMAAPQLPGGDRPANDVPSFATIPDAQTPAASVPEDASTSAAPQAPESTPVPRTAAADLAGVDLTGVDLTAALPADSPPAAVPAPRDRLVKVFYGTDRRAKGDPQEFLEWSIGWAPGVLAGFVALLTAMGAYLLPGRRLLFASATGFAVSVAGVLILRGPLAGEPPTAGSSELGVEYTSERGRLSVGWCEVSIPPHHVPGEVESPSILRLEFRPDPERHVVLQRVVRDEHESFFEAVRERVQQSPRHDLFVFVHGYNVSFEDAARRTAQISFDLRFEGAAIFFSWPSQGEIIKYTVDENNVAWSTAHLKEFLLDVVRRTDAKSVNLIAHSMGNRALVTAIREIEAELDKDEAIFDEVVLAAPDVDAAIFKRDIAPALARTSRHATLYASTHDQALLVSKFVHGYPRAGDSGAGLVVVDGVETIDVSRIDLSLLGHSYYGSSEPILEDLSELISESLRPSQRSWLQPAERNGMKYWKFREDLQSRRPRMSMRP